MFPILDKVATLRFASVPTFSDEKHEILATYALLSLAKN